jgi:hypothetical protein
VSDRQDLAPSACPGKRESRIEASRIRVLHEFVRRSFALKSVISRCHAFAESNGGALGSRSLSVLPFVQIGARARTARPAWRRIPRHRGRPIDTGALEVSAEQNRANLGVDQRSALSTAWWWHRQHDTSSERTPRLRMLPSVIGSPAGDLGRWAMAGNVPSRQGRQEGPPARAIPAIPPLLSGGTIRSSGLTFADLCAAGRAGLLGRRRITYCSPVTHSFCTKHGLLDRDRPGPQRPASRAL